MRRKKQKGKGGGEGVGIGNVKGRSYHAHHVQTIHLCEAFRCEAC